MAEIHLDELMKIVKEHQYYKERWMQGVKIEQAFYISFSEKDSNITISTSEEFTLSNGMTLLLDKGEDGKIYGLEIT
jgi:hypothetical protein